MSKPLILFVTANPQGTDPLRLDRECRDVENELRLSAGRDDFAFRSTWAVTVDQLMRELNLHKPTVLHFSGHGTTRGICLEDETGRVQTVTARALAKMVGSAGKGVRLVVLNACYSDDQADAIRAVTDCVVGMVGPVADAAARSFSVGLYRALGYRASVGDAFAQAEATLMAKGLLVEPSDAASAGTAATKGGQPRLVTRDGVDAGTVLLSAEAGAPPTAAGGGGAGGGGTGGAGASAGPLLPAGGAGGGGTGGAGASVGPLVAAGRAPRYDLFLAHASADKASARTLYDLLRPAVKVFLDERSLLPGDNWTKEIPAAQRDSRATVVLMSPRSDAGWYLGAEVVAAIAMHRAAPDGHRLLPVILERGASVPYGLSVVQAIDAEAEGGLAGVAAHLRDAVDQLRGLGAVVSTPTPTSPGPGAACDAVALHDRLLRVPDVMFEQLLFQCRVERSLIKPTSASLAERVLDVAQLAALDGALCQCLSTRLDQQAPWTRGTP